MQKGIIWGGERGQVSDGVRARWWRGQKARQEMRRSRSSLTVSPLLPDPSHLTPTPQIALFIAIT